MRGRYWGGFDGNGATVMIGTILLVILAIVLLGGLRDWGPGPFYGTGRYGGIGLGTVFIILLILVIMGRF